MNKLQLSLIALFSIFLVLISCSFAAAQSPYPTSKVTPVTIPLNGTFTGSAEGLGVSFEIKGLPGATGSVTTTVYSGNPQSGAFIPDGVKLTRFVVIEFDMSESDFSSSTITISYSDADVLGLDEPFSLFKYLPSSNSFVELTGVFDTHDRTVTFTLTSTDDPLFAIGGSASGSVEPSSTPWVVLGVSVVVIVLLVVVGFWFFKKRSE